MDQETALTPIIWGLEETPLRVSQALGVLKIGTGGVRTTTDYFFLKRNGWQNSPRGVIVGKAETTRQRVTSNRFLHR